MTLEPISLDFKDESTLILTRKIAEGGMSIVYEARKLGVETPISEAVAAILAGEVGVDDAILGLLSRPLKAER